MAAKKRVAGICKLCTLRKDLCDSHLMPRSMYVKARGSGPGDQNPYIITSKSAKQTQYQIHDYVFCQSCEQRLSAKGEAYVIPLVMTSKKFKLLEILETAQATLIGPTVKAFSISDTPMIDRSKVLYFGASVFWRASIHEWKNRDGTTTHIDLDSDYNEELRRFLIGQAPFPQLATLMLVVCTDAIHHEIFCMPAMEKKPDHSMSMFMARGLLFFFSMGPTVPSFLRKYGLGNSPEQWIVSRDCSKKGLVWALK